MKNKINIIIENKDKKNKIEAFTKFGDSSNNEIIGYYIKIQKEWKFIFKKNTLITKYTQNNLGNISISIRNLNLSINTNKLRNLSTISYNQPKNSYNYFELIDNNEPIGEIYLEKEWIYEPILNLEKQYTEEDIDEIWKKLWEIKNKPKHKKS